MADRRIDLIEQYRKKVKAANKELTKKELFKDLLNRLYPNDVEITKILDAISKGAEATIVNIPRKDKLHKGSADTLYNRIIIEFENNLKTTLDHAKEQLAGYLLGLFSTGEGYNFTLIASDFITWKVFSPDILLIDKLGELTEDELLLHEVTSASFSLTENNALDFYYWIDRFLFKEEKHRATLKRIEESFGYQSNTFIECYRQLRLVFQDAKKYGEVQVSHEQWQKFLSVAYGTFEEKGNEFIIHTNLSVFAKMLAYTVISNDDYIDEQEMKEILDGTIFHKFNIANFVDNDFFHWVQSERTFHELKKVFRLIAQEISTFDFSSVDEDILKGVYQELIDLDTRHSLGEYYTPDWLCERVINEFDFRITDKILDPACGSGSFLRAATHRIKKLHPEISIEELNQAVYGIDIHPLSVLIAKTTVLLALGKDIIQSKRPIYLNIIQANTLLAPEGVQNLFGDEFVMQIDKDKYTLNTQIFEDAMLFDEAIQVCDELAERTLRKKEEKLQVFESIIRKQYKNGGFSQQVIESFYKLYLGFKKAKENGRDSIWKFIVQNLYKPYFYAGKFNYVIGNPPWFTYSSIRNEDYQKTLNGLAEKYNVKPERKANYPHLEIAAIFLSYCSSYFLKETGKIAFVLPRSFLSADHHDNTRRGKSKGFDITEIWDLEKVTPLFRIPSCVLFADKKNGNNKIITSGIPGRNFNGILPYHNCNLESAKIKLIEKEIKWFYIKQGKSSAFSTSRIKSKKEINLYKKFFKQGATIVPRAFYFVELTQEMPPDWNGRILNIKTTDEIKRDAKKPWKNIDFKGKIESNFLFRTALSKSILPFALYKPVLVVLPLIIAKDQDEEKIIRLNTSENLLKQGYLNASKWFRNAENIWEINKTSKNRNIECSSYLDWQNKLTKQNLNIPYLVLYNASAKDANATIVQRSQLDLSFIVESKAYWYGTESIYEAYYLVSVLNSNILNRLIKNFQTRGLFGARDVHKKILDIYFPKFNDKEPLHALLAKYGENAHERTRQYLHMNPPQRELTPFHLGRLRSAIKKYLTPEMKEIDNLVKKIILS